LQNYTLNVKNIDEAKHNMVLQAANIVNHTWSKFVIFIRESEINKKQL